MASHPSQCRDRIRSHWRVVDERKQNKEQMHTKNFGAAQKALILGGGPTGLFAALKLLEAIPHSYVRIIEKREKINRPQVINSAYEAINTLPDKVKQRLWPNAEIRGNIFNDHQKHEPGFWPYSEYKHLPLFQIAEFQRAIKDYLYETYRGQIEIIYCNNFTIADFEEIAHNFNLVLVTTGDCPLARDLRKVLSIHDRHVEQKAEIDTRAMYLTYRSSSSEFYERNGNLLTRASLAANGVTYGHSNDQSNHVQIYTFPFGQLKEVFEVMPQSMKAVAAFPNSKLTFDGKLSDGSELSQEEKFWFSIYSNAVVDILKKFAIDHPSYDQIRVFSAERMEYFYEKAAARYFDVPVMFLGDACGATDFRLGLGLGRSLLMTLNLIQNITNYQNFSFDGIIEAHNIYWKHVLDTEFNKRNHKLTKTPEMVYKYFMKGRSVDGTIIGDEHREDFLREVRRVEQLTAKIEMYVATHNPSAIALRNV